MMAAITATPATTPTTIPAMAPPLIPDFLFFELDGEERLASDEVAVGSVTIEVVVMKIVCCCWLDPVETDAVTILVV